MTPAEAYKGVPDTCFVIGLLAGEFQPLGSLLHE